MKNVEEIGWFVWNMVMYDLREVVNLLLKVLLLEEDEFNFVGVIKEKCIEVLGYCVKELLVYFECEYV